jgi:hypothetical protein
MTGADHVTSERRAPREAALRASSAVGHGKRELGVAPSRSDYRTRPTCTLKASAYLAIRPAAGTMARTTSPFALLRGRAIGSRLSANSERADHPGAGGR